MEALVATFNQEKALVGPSPWIMNIQLQASWRFVWSSSAGGCSAGAGVLGTSMCAHRAFLPSHTDAARARGLSHINTLGAVFIGESSAIFLECIKHRNNSDRYRLHDCVRNCHENAGAGIRDCRVRAVNSIWFWINLSKTRPYYRIFLDNQRKWKLLRQCCWLLCRNVWLLLLVMLVAIQMWRGPRPMARQAAARLRLVLQKVPSEDDPKVRNHGEGPY